MTALESIIETKAPEAPDSGASGRMTTAQVLSTVFLLGTHLHAITEAYSRLSEAQPKEVVELLKTIIDKAGAVRDKASRLLEANR